MTRPRDLIKQAGGWALAKLNSKLSYRNCIFVLAHMRCGSTALSNIICSRADVSGYGETHVRYDGQAALGRLALNQMRHKRWNGDADFLFDKILHSRHDSAVPPDFFAAKAIFMVREPEPSIRSICKLFTDLQRNEYRTFQAAAEYYVERLAAIANLWDQFGPANRIGLTHGELLADPDRVLAEISGRFAFAPPLINAYFSPEASRRGGGGDPMESGKHSRIEPALMRPGRPLEELGLPPLLAGKALASYENLRGRFASD